MPTRDDLRNVAIIAHVDHGKTTLVDALLRQAGALGRSKGEGTDNDSTQDRVMDSMDLERERGITILAKNTAIHLADENGNPVVINIVDTPGHADFGGEVERGLSMVDGVVLLVDASEGPLPQTRFVLRKALGKGLPVILVVNKTDRSDARIGEVVDETYELFMELLEDSGMNVDNLDFPIVYCNGKAGKASLTRPADGGTPDSPGPSRNVSVTRRLVPEGVTRTAPHRAGPSEPFAIARIHGVLIGDTLADPNAPRPLPPLTLDEPSISITTGINTSPLSGKSV